MQRVLSFVDPWGDDRADLRAAVNTIHAMKLPDDANFEEIFDALRDYVTTDDENELYDEDALAAVKGA